MHLSPTSIASNYYLNEFRNFEQIEEEANKYEDILSRIEFLEDIRRKVITALRIRLLDNDDKKWSKKGRLLAPRDQSLKTNIKSDNQKEIIPSYLIRTLTREEKKFIILFEEYYKAEYRKIKNITKYAELLTNYQKTIRNREITPALPEHQEHFNWIDSEEKRNQLYDNLLKAKFIPSIKYDDFSMIFRQAADRVIKYEPIIWYGKQTELVIFIEHLCRKELINENKKWKITACCFRKKDDTKYDEKDLASAIQKAKPSLGCRITKMIDVIKK